MFRYIMGDDQGVRVDTWSNAALLNKVILCSTLHLIGSLAEKDHHRATILCLLRFGDMFGLGFLDARPLLGVAHHPANIQQARKILRHVLHNDHHFARSDFRGLCFVYERVEKNNNNNNNTNNNTNNNNNNNNKTTKTARRQSKNPNLRLQG